MGIRGSPTAELAFDGVRVPVANRVGAEGDGFGLAMRTFDRSRPGIAAQAVGIAQGALDAAAAYAGQRRAVRPADRRAPDGPGACSPTWTPGRRRPASSCTPPASEIERGAPDAARWAAMCKLVAGDTAMAVTTDAVQVFGGYGYIDEYPVERMMRDAKITQLYEGTQQIQRLVVARALLARHLTPGPRFTQGDVQMRADRRAREAGARPGRGTPRRGWTAGPDRVRGHQRQRRVRPRGGPPARGGARGRGDPPLDGACRPHRDHSQGARDGCGPRGARERPGARGRTCAGPRPRSSPRPCGPWSTTSCSWEPTPRTAAAAWSGPRWRPCLGHPYLSRARRIEPGPRERVRVRAPERDRLRRARGADAGGRRPGRSCSASRATRRSAASWAHARRRSRSGRSRRSGLPTTVGGRCARHHDAARAREPPASRGATRVVRGADPAAAAAVIVDFLAQRRAI